MKDFFRKNKYLLLVLLCALVVLVGMYLLGIVVSALKILCFMPLAFLLGMGYTGFFKRILPIKNIITFVGISLFLGIFINTFVIFLLGTLGIGVGVFFFKVYILVALLLNIFLFFRNIQEIEVQKWVKSTKLKLIDIVWAGIFITLLIFFASECLETYYFLWDGFTFWALDAKYIFENGHLRDGSFVLLANNYLSFFSLQINYIYLLYGKIVEQTAGLLSLFYGYIGVILVYGRIIEEKEDILKRILLYIGILATLYSMFTVHYLLMSLYSDVFLSVVVLVYAIIIFNKNYDERSYWQRLTLLVLLAVSVYLTKTHFFVFSICLLVFFLLFDYKIIFKKFKYLLKEWQFGFSILLLAAIVMLIYRYANLINSGESAFVHNAISAISIDKSILSNLKNLVKELMLKIPLMAVVIGLYFPLAFVVSKGFKNRDIVKILFLFLMTSFTFVVYILGIYPLSDGSIFRYLGLVYFALPYLFAGIIPRLEINIKWQKILSTILIMILPILIVVQIGFRTGVDLKFTPNSGVYKESEAHKEYSNIVDEVRRTVPHGSSIMVASYGVGSTSLTDNFPPGFFLRYYLMDYSKTSAYYCLPSECASLFLSKAPDYLLLYSYENYWPECNGILEKGKSYLIKFDLTEEILKSGRCVATSENLTIL